MILLLIVFVLSIHYSFRFPYFSKVMP